MLLIIALAQADTSVPPGRINPTSPQRCETLDSLDADVLVCGRRNDPNRYRLPPLTPYQSELPKAELQLGNDTSVSAETQRVVIGGLPSNRVMIRLKIKF